jgi:alanyl-tRNA synthetase
VSDSGRIVTEAGGAAATIERIVRARPEWPRLHQVRVTAGTIRVRDLVTAEVDREAREATRRNHTATHLLHAALRQVLGAHVKQAGSLVAPDRLRFDFVHFAAVTPGELADIERIVNDQIRKNSAVLTEIKATHEAIAAGATALFGEKYGDHVRVVSVPGFSLELCGGTHCARTGDIGLFAVVQEGGIAAGVRRIDGVTGAAAVNLFQDQRRTIDNVLAALGVPGDQALEAIGRLQADAKRLAREASQLKMKVAMGVGLTDPQQREVNGVIIVVRRVDGLDKSGLREMADSLKDRHERAVIVLASESDGKVAIVVSVTKAMAGRVHAGKIVKQIAPIVGGGGGGRPDFAEAGGKDPDRIDDVLREAERLIEQLVA